MKNKKGFTLLELIAVIIVLGVLLLISVPSVKKFIDRGKNTTYQSHEKSLQNAARNLMIDCLSGKYICSIPTTNTEARKINYTQLVANGYCPVLKDPENQNEACTYSYVIIRYDASENNATTNQNSETSLTGAVTTEPGFKFSVCLKCSKYETSNCLDSNDILTNFEQ